MVRYSHLDPQKSEIRLVTLLPGRTRDAIRCTLSTSSLDSAPEYTALSYVWGDPSETKPITIDGEPFNVTVNLEAGLRAIRKRWRRRVLWIDAICINQQDVQEKNVQLPQMGRLYSTAPAVLLWIGPSNPCIEMCVSWMRAHGTRSYNAASAYWLGLDSRAALSRSGKQDRDWALVQAYEGFYDFMALSYWSRVWTFQEYTLPRVAPVCLCGDIKPFRLTTMLEDHAAKTLKKVAGEILRRSAAGRDKTELLNRLETKFMAGISTATLALSSWKDYTQDSLATLLYYTANRKSFDEHDKIFALYGMLPAVQDVYPPDYTKPIHDVMLQAATFIVNVENRCCFLWTQFGLRNERLSDVSRLYPSWVPDFTQTHITYVSRPRPDFNLHIYGQVAMPLKLLEDIPSCISVEHKTLRFWARRLGTCKVAVRFAHTRSNILEKIKELLEMNVSENFMGKPVRKPETFVARMARACVAHESSLSNVPTKAILETFYSVFRPAPDSVQTSVHKSHILIAADELAGKELLITEDGCFGISVGGAKDGDIIVIPPQVQHPFVLTPETGDRVGHFKMVGTAIIDGVMGAGELFDEELVEEIAKRDVVEFLIH